MHSRVGLATVLVVSAAVAGCEDDGPTIPTGTTVIVYQNTNYGGDQRALPNSAPNLGDLPGCGGTGAHWDDCISSIRVPPGWSVTLFEGTNYSGASTTLTADTPDLHNVPGPCGDDWDDCADSIQVRQP